MIKECFSFFLFLCYQKIIRIALFYNFIINIPVLLNIDKPVSQQTKLRSPICGFYSADNQSHKKLTDNLPLVFAGFSMQKQKFKIGIGTLGSECFINQKPTRKNNFTFIYNIAYFFELSLARAPPA